MYLAVSLRNVGSGIAVMFGWALMRDLVHNDVTHSDLDAFRMQN